MLLLRFFQLTAALLTTQVAARPRFLRQAAGNVTNAQTSLTLLYQNNLNASDDVNHVGAILLSPESQAQSSSACNAIGESLLSQETLQAHESDFAEQLSYQTLAGYAESGQSYYISTGVVSSSGSNSSLVFQASSLNNTELPVLCTQSSNQNGPGNAAANATNELTVSSTGNTYVGFRNQKSFRFLGIPYADPPQRWVYSTPYSKTGQTIQATSYGSQCAQTGSGGSEDCLFLNIQTPYVPQADSTTNLRPVHFWVHGGGFTGGSGADANSDGGNLASREDIVTVTINYRLSTLGFLAIPNSDVTGNYGIADQINALEWTIANIASFGGDPNQITINGESAGAGSTRVLLGSPPAIGKYQGAISMSNLGGGVTLGLTGDYATTYSSYLTVPASYALAGQNIFRAAGCNQTSLTDQITCLSSVDALSLISLPTVARYVVQDGTYVNTEQLIVSTSNASTAHVPVIFGNVADDGASFCTYPRSGNLSTESQVIQASLGISAPYADGIISSGLFPYYDTGNLTLDSFNVSARVSTDIQFRCIDQATVYAGVSSSAFPKAYYYQMDRSIYGYDPNGLGGPAPTPGFPNGNPDVSPYFRLHGADMPWMFGNLPRIRDANDLYSVQVGADHFGAFIRSGDPNPSEEFLSTLGYTVTLANLQANGRWEAVGGEEGPIRRIDYPSPSTGFVDVPQCQYLNYSLSYYLEGGS
ncbi:MAG: hypothetical protein Q9160_001211 [Pyrenula sp. 1 TL-2023]